MTVMIVHRVLSFLPAVVVAVGTVLAAAASAPAGDLVFADVLNFTDPEGNSIRRIHTDGTGLVTIIPTGGGVRGVDVDAAAGLVYWTVVDNAVIRRAHLDGTGQQDLISPAPDFPSALRLNVSAGKFYWGDQTGDHIWNANLTGEIPQIVTTTPFNRGLALDTLHGRMYWTTSVTASSGQILSAALDGTDQQTVQTYAASKPGNLAIDPAGGKLYWTDPLAGYVRRSNLDGSSVQNLFDARLLGRPKGVAVNPAANEMYFALDIEQDESPLMGLLYRMDLDGNNPQPISGGLGSVNDIVFVPEITCPADFNHSGGASVQDIFDFLTAYFSNDPRADVNHSNAVSVQDIFDFLGMYFAGCP
jgi:DNA-binding beta-propeller fold protein YncE